MGLFNWLFRRMCYKIFDSVDRNKSGTIEQIEIEVAIYQLYNIINKRLPGWQDPPTRVDISKSLALYDTNKNGVLEKDEFVEFARGLVQNGPDMFFSRVGKDAIIKTAIVPAATKGVQLGAVAAGFTTLQQVPLHIAAPMAGVIFGAVKALLPIGL